MVSRRPPRAVWLPSLLLWAPLLVAGLWTMMGVRFDASSRGGGAWFVRLIVPSPSYWFTDPLASLGVVLLVAGLAAWMLSLAQPDPRRWLMVAARYPEFAFAGHVLLLAAFLSMMRFEGPVFDFGRGGVSWGAIASLGNGPNLAVAGVLAAVALASYALSLGTSRRLPGGRARTA